jgi:hypothetical protein
VRLASAAERTAEVDIQDARIPVLVGARRPHPPVAGVADQRDVLVGDLVALVGNGVADGVLFWACLVSNITSMGTPFEVWSEINLPCSRHPG